MGKNLKMVEHINSRAMYIRTLPVKIPSPKSCSAAFLIGEGPIHNPQPPLPAGTSLLSELLPPYGVGDGQVPPAHPSSSSLISVVETTPIITATKQRMENPFGKENFERKPDPMVKNLFASELSDIFNAFAVSD